MISWLVLFLLILIILSLSGWGYGTYRGGAYASPLGGVMVLLVVLLILWLLFGGVLYLPPVLHPGP